MTTMNCSIAIIQAIHTFVNAADTRNTSVLAAVMHDAYQNIQDGFFEQKGIFIFSKTRYIELIETKRFGGSPRTIKIESIDERGNIAIAKVILESELLCFSSNITLVNENSEWKVLYNVPSIRKKS